MLFIIMLALGFTVGLFICLNAYSQKPWMEIVFISAIVVIVFLAYFAKAPFDGFSSEQNVGLNLILCLIAMVVGLFLCVFGKVFYHILKVIGGIIGDCLQSLAK